MTYNELQDWIRKELMSAKIDSRIFNTSDLINNIGKLELGDEKLQEENSRLHRSLAQHKIILSQLKFVCESTSIKWRQDKADPCDTQKDAYSKLQSIRELFNITDCI